MKFSHTQVSKTWLLLLAVVACFALSSCNKEKMCRCAVVGTQQVRMFSVKQSSNCKDLKGVQYLDPVHIKDIVGDSIFCLDAK